MNPKNIILTGLPRSGTTLSCHLLNQLPNVVALHEPMDIKKLGQGRDGATLIAAVQEFFHKNRASILSTGAALSKHAGGVVPDNPFSNERLATGKRRSLVSHGTIQIDKPLTDNFLLVIKHPIAFTAALEQLQEHFPSHAIVRNPLATLASWNSVAVPVADGHAPAAEQLDLRLREELARLTDKTDRQLHLLSWCFEKYGRLLPRSSVIRYEEIIGTGGGALYPITPQAIKLNQPLASKNLNSLYDREGMLRLGEKLLASDGAYWDFYSRESVIALMDTASREVSTLSRTSSAPSAAASNNKDTASGNRRPLPIALVIGCARSGTSILGEAIAAHPEVKYIFEPHHVWDQAGPGENESHRLTESHASPSLIEGFRSWFAGKKGGAQLLVDKTPRNALRVPFLRAVFPEAKFIHIVRDGRDVACSLLPGIGGAEWRHLKPPTWQTLQAQSAGLERCARTWQEVVEMATADLEGVPHLRVSYEQLVADPRTVMAQVQSFLGLSPDPAVDAFCQRIQDKTSGSYHARHQQNFFRDNHAHRVGCWRENASADEQILLQRLLQPTLGKLGYGDCLPASEPPAPRHPKLDPSPPVREHSPLMELVRMTTPPEARVLVISKGDSALLDLEGRPAGHFPQTDSGVYLGHHPADSAEAIARLETLRCRGAEYLIIPESSLWWLEHYRGFHEFLQGECPLVAQQKGVGQIHHLQKIRRVPPKRPLRVVAVLCVRNEERFIAHSLRHLTAQGLEIHLIDNGSTDRTVELARQFLGHGLRRIEHLPHDGIFRLPAILRRKEELAATLDADWIMHSDADEIALPPPGSLTLAEAIAAADEAGYNIINFIEHTFVPTLEAPDHDHADYQKTMRWYYPFAPRIPWQMRAWKKSSLPVSLASSGGHLPRFTGARLYPEFFRLKHYQFLSMAHASKKYGSRNHDPEALRAGLHGGPQGWRNRFCGTAFDLPSQAELRAFCGDDSLDSTCPWATHWIEKAMRALQPK
jgi:hypothetical protein